MPNKNLILGTINVKKVELVEAMGKKYEVNYDLPEIVETKKSKEALIKINYLLDNMDFESNYTIGSPIELLAYSEILKSKNKITGSEFNKIRSKVFEYFKNTKLGYVILIFCKKNADDFEMDLHYKICKYLRILTGLSSFHDGYIELEDLSAESNASYLKQFKID